MKAGKQALCVICFIGVCGLLNASETESVEHSELRDIAQAKVKLFASQLKTELQTAIKDKGLVNAVEVCHNRAPAIAEQLSTNGWQLKRTSLKTRNQNNQPDAWERQILEKFTVQLIDKKRSKQQNAPLSAEQHNDQSYRYMQAIVTQPLCLSCHGDKLEPTLAKKINELYPNDQAIQFKAGDLRGAFSLIKQL